MSAVDSTPGAFRNIADPELAARYRAEGWWGDETLGDRVRSHAATRGDATAFVTAEHRMTWTQYNDCSDRLAGAIIAAGIQPGEKVSVLLPDGATVHTAFVGLEKAGVILVGIGARAGDREIKYLLGRTGAVALVTFAEQRGRDMAALFAELKEEGLQLKHHIVVPKFEADPDGPILVNGEAIDINTSTLASDIDTRKIRPDDLFMLNSTSGTTGMPKCVMHTQNRWFYFHKKAVEFGRLTDGDVVHGAVPAPFGFGQWTSHFSPALMGAACVVLERWTPELALEFMERERVSMIACVSTQFIMMLNSPDWGKRDLSSLRAMFTGGEMIPYEQAKRFEETTGASVLQFFGSNETGLLSGTQVGEPLEKRLTTAGKIVPEMHVRLFDEGKDVTDTGRGQPGCKGPATCIGYYDDPAANKELFTEDGWMLMADICTLDDDGYIAVVGRKSDIIIRGGKNISAAQVEDAVTAHPKVALAAAVAMPDPVFGERVCVYVELRKDETSLDLKELLEHMNEAGVSKELMPEHLIVMDELPRSSGAKLAKGELKADLMKRMAEQKD